MEAAWKSASFLSDGSSRISDFRCRMIDSSAYRSDARNRRSSDSAAARLSGSISRTLR